MFLKAKDAMAEVTITLASFDAKFYVTVDLTIVKSLEPKMKGRLKEGTQRLKTPDGNEIPPGASEAACFSEAFFALRKTGGYEYEVTIVDAFGELPLGGLTICAVAASVGVSYAVDHRWNTKEESLDGWRLTGRSKRGTI